MFSDSAARLALCTAFFALACSKDSTGPSTPSLAAYAGTWSGTTSQSRSLTMWVGAAGVMDSLRVQISVPIISGMSSCIVTYHPATISIAQDRTFSATLPSAGGISGVLSGTFTSTSAANGTYQAGWTNSVVCGSTITFGSGGNSSSGTWTATKT